MTRWQKEKSVPDTTGGMTVGTPENALSAQLINNWSADTMKSFVCQMLEPVPFRQARVSIIFVISVSAEAGEVYLHLRLLFL